ncbi:SDR family oxidoreductase [Paenibacillus ginsengarvi]|uniref:SDR family oxidoreductase n=1 Tax=Paenibacillus ginsengarvi TaxID=400777 RepID=A0A3B0CDF1_9BACL|nr:SDR family oxidoreductase [Paenibacillus ginsengarvi]RKN84205.1 SDR family oxidoreductase [Paenibacillus ginsengarvi]
MDLHLADKTVIVTAGSKGLGKASAVQFAREGANVVIASRNQEHLDEAKADILRQTGREVRAVVADVNRKDHITEIVRTAIDWTGRLDVLVTNAGGPPGGGFDQFDDAAWEAAFQQNLMSVVRLIREALPFMRQQGGGRIVNLTSVSVKQPIPDLILSNVFRAGVYALTKSLSAELGKDSILVNTVGPGRIETDRIVELDRIAAERRGATEEQIRSQHLNQIPLGRYGTPEEFAKTIVYLGSFANTYVTGQAVLVDGGMVRAL